MPPPPNYNPTGANCNFLFGAKSDKRPGSIQVIQWIILLLGYLKWDPRDPILTYIKKKKKEQRGRVIFLALVVKLEFM